LHARSNEANNRHDRQPGGLCGRLVRDFEYQGEDFGEAAIDFLRHRRGPSRLLRGLGGFFME
jgi:hypothetical protein